MLIAGNWKMNGLDASITEVKALKDALKAHPSAAKVLICPPATLVSRVAQVAGPEVEVGGQDCHAKVSGAYTGDIAPEMLADAGAKWVIVGHSERRDYHKESDEFIAEKTKAGWRAGLKVIVCVGESEAQRVAGKQDEIVGHQLSFLPEGATADNLVIAYEPIWAIGTGKIPTIAEIDVMHNFIRATLSAKFGAAGDKMEILYGGSVKPNNAKEIFTVKNVNGALVGGASLKAKDFLAIIEAVPA